MGSEELIRKGFSIENDIQNMGQVERVRYAANLSYQLQEIPYEENHGQERWDAKHLVDRMWALSVDEMKISQSKGTAISSALIVPDFTFIANGIIDS